MHENTIECTVIWHHVISYYEILQKVIGFNVETTLSWIWYKYVVVQKNMSFHIISWIIETYEIEQE